MKTKMGQKIVTDPSAFSVAIKQTVSANQGSILQKSPENDFSDSNHLQFPDYTCL